MPSKQGAKAKPLRIGITGGIGSGKTLACSYFEKEGYKVIYADDIAKRLYKNNTDLKKNLVRAFGKGILDESGNISRANARKIIFSTKKNIQRVNSIVHPFVIKEIDRIISALKDKVVLIETAIMFESGYYNRNDYNVLIYANKSIRAKRVRQRDNVSLASVKKLMTLQMDENEKVMLADFIIKNNGSVKELRQNVKLFCKILEIL
jgi:dephospho-CoA kinase